MTHEQIDEMARKAARKYVEDTKRSFGECSFDERVAYRLGFLDGAQAILDEMKPELEKVLRQRDRGHVGEGE